MTAPKPGPRKPEEKPKAGAVLLDEPVAASHLLPGMTVFEPRHKGEKGCDARTPKGEPLKNRGVVAQVSLRFDPDSVVVILKDRKRWRYEPVAPVWAAFVVDVDTDEDSEAGE